MESQARGDTVSICVRTAKVDSTDTMESKSAAVHQPGLEWVYDQLMMQPRWTEEPSLPAIEELMQETLCLDEKPTAKLMGQGAFNKIYLIESNDLKVVLRVALPVDPKRKTRSEAATLKFVAAIDSLPTPKIQAYSSFHPTPIGYEWMLMNYIPGTQLEDQWLQMSWQSKQDLVKQIAKYCASTFRYQSDSIGNIFPRDSHDGSIKTLTKNPTIGPIVSMHFFWEDHIRYPVSRGPFTSSRDWLLARLAFEKLDAEQEIQTCDDEEDRFYAGKILEIIKRLEACIDKVFPPLDGRDNDAKKGQEKTILFHDDLNATNILVDPVTQKVTGVLDWECVSFMPLWKACQFPEFLQSRGMKQVNPPKESDYPIDEETGKVDSDFVEDIKQWDKTRLRKIFLQHLEEEEGDEGKAWLEEWKVGAMKRDLDLAVQECSEFFSMKRIWLWLDDVENDEEGRASLHERIYGVGGFSDQEGTPPSPVWLTMV